MAVPANPVITIATMNHVKAYRRIFVPLQEVVVASGASRALPVSTAQEAERTS
jgi:hypothetical protein